MAVLAASVVAQALLAATAYRLTSGIFLGRRRAARHGEATRDRAWVAPLVLALGGLALGVSGLAATLAARFSSRPGAELELPLVPHLGGALLATLATWALAVVLYRRRERLAGLVARWPSVSAPLVWQGMLDGVVRLGEEFSRRWENGSLRWYLAGTVLTMPLGVAYALRTVNVTYGAISVDLGEMPWYGLLYCVLLIMATRATVQARTRLAAAIASSSVGFLVAMIYVVYRSPDILLTQILIETVSTIFLLLVIVHLPAFPPRDLTPGARLLNAAIAGGFGLVVTLLLLLAMTPGVRAPQNIATQPGGLLSLSLAEGGGANAVNVIIVDIRALDTNGEITVLVVVCLCIYGLLRTRREAP
jgi:multisubunit Na+/H+ antiporter MnhB subunit